jgi:hypothetical protein
MRANMLLTIEKDPGAEEVEIFCDPEGLDSLINTLERLRKHRGHEHLMTPAWVGHALTEDRQRAGNELVHHLRITLRPE